jgi:quercetin dioxygenase-like cupin family protein
LLIVFYRSVMDGAGRFIKGMIWWKSSSSAAVCEVSICTFNSIKPMKMTQYLPLLKFLSGLSLWLIPALLAAREPQIEVQQILQTTQSWDNSPYISYPTGQPQVTVLRIKIPPNTALHWHRHPVISVGYVLSGELTLEKKATGERTIVHAGQALAETIQTTHRGFTTNEPVELVVFYAGQVGLPITTNEE